MLCARTRSQDAMDDARGFDAAEEDCAVGQPAAGELLINPDRQGRERHQQHNVFDALRTLERAGLLGVVMRSAVLCHALSKT